jgi:hypothetical protein
VVILQPFPRVHHHVLKKEFKEPRSDIYTTMFSKKNSKNPGLIYIAMVLKILAKISNNHCLHNCWFFDENC